DIVSADSSGKYTGWLKKIVKSTNETWQNIWVMSWDTKWGGVFSLIDPKVQANDKVAQPVKDAVHYFNKWHVEYWSHVPHDANNDTNHLSNTPGGLAWLTTWGSARYNSAAQLEALSYRKNFPDDPKSVKFSDWAMGQMNYLMGDNPLNRSYIVGFGSTTPGVGSQVGGKATSAQHPHHAAAHGSLTNNQDEPPTHRHILWGALVGGPNNDDEHSDITTDYVLNEVAIDYNAALPGALAGLYQYYGQNQKMTDFTPPPEAEEQPYYSTAKLNQASNQGTQVTLNVHNLATHPPHFQDQMSLRYFFSIKPLVEHGQGIEDVSTPVYYDAGKSFDGVETNLGKPVRWGGEKSCLYYVPIDWTGNPVSGTRAFQFGVNSGISDDFKFYWDSAPSPSFTGLKDGKYESTPDPHVPVYIDGEKVFGEEPSLTTDLTCGTGGDPGGDEVTATAQYQVTNTDATTNQITNKIQLTNTGAKAALSDFTLRYWFTGDEGSSFTYACDYTPIGCKNVVGTIHEVSPAVTNADRYLELGFTSAAGTLKVGGTTGPIQSRLHRSDHGTMSQSNDYSFRAAATSLTDSPKITVYYQGKLIYGTPPS
ncbi:MAG: endoglucanase, partial [Actinomycetota bacterium]|nr:endoglucanase [Actinomycetota bacterium]